MILTNPSDIVRAIRAATGAKPGDTIEVVTPQFTRPASDPGPASPPADMDAWKALPRLPETALRELGLRPWGREHEHDDGTESGRMLWMFPGEWYNAIPNGLPVVDIFFREETFICGVTDNDIRFGCLAYGVLKEPDNVDASH